MLIREKDWENTSMLEIEDNDCQGIVNLQQNFVENFLNKYQVMLSSFDTLKKIKKSTHT